VKLEIMVLTYL